MSKKIPKIGFFLLLILVFNLTSCGLVVINYDKFGDVTETEATADNTETTVVTTEEPDITIEAVENDYTDEIKENLATITDKKYNNAVFKIVTPEDFALSTEDNIEFFSEFVAKRNERISEKHSVSIVASSVDPANYYNELNTAVKSGMYYADLVMASQETIGTFAVNGLLLNLRSMPGLDLDADYFSQTSVGAASGGFHSYAVAGYASIYPYSLPTLFFNKDLVGESGIDPYALVESGKWTWDKFFEIGLLATDKTDIFSWGTTDLGNSVYESAFVSCGLQMVNSGVMKVPELGFDAESAVNAVNVVKQLYADTNSIHTNPDSMSYFASGLGYFQFEKLSAIFTLKDSSVQWGILPLPVDEAGKTYTTLAGSDSYMFACPVTVSTPEKSAIILMSLNAASEGELKDGLIKHLQYNYLRDNQSTNMLDYIIDGAVYDFSYTFGHLYYQIYDGTYGMIRQSVYPWESMSGLIANRKGSLDLIFTEKFGLSN